jgi:hypothetical protein
MSSFNEAYQEIQEQVPVLQRGGKFQISTENFRKYMKIAYDKGATSKQMDKLFGSLFK